MRRKQRRVGVPPEAKPARRTITLTLEADEVTLDRLAALMLFSDFVPPQKEPEEEWVPPIDPMERESIRQRMRDAIHEYARKHGIEAAKERMLRCGGCTGIATATDEHLALLLYYFTMGD